MKILKIVFSTLVFAASSHAGDGIFTNVRADGVASGYFSYPSLEVFGRGGVLFRGTGEGTTNSYSLATSYSNAFLYDAGLSSVSIGDVYLPSFSGRNSLIVGASNSLAGDNSMAVGTGNSLNGDNSFAAGYLASASGSASVALNSSVAAGSYSTAINAGATTASYAFAQGAATASGVHAAGFGVASAASAYSVAVGRYNATVDYSGAPVNATTWASNDPVFSVGIGASTAARQDALVVYKGGQVKIPKRQGDIIMGEFGNGNGD
jgi:hypothetical protein